jgi:hypothetical protein
MQSVFDDLFLVFLGFGWETAPKCAAVAPKLDSVAHDIEAQNLLIGLISSADDAQVLRIKFDVVPRVPARLAQIFCEASHAWY